MTEVALTRRGLLRSALAAGVVLPLSGFAGGTPRLALPAPTGPHRIGTETLHLTESAGRRRELMAGVWYPAAGAGRGPRAPWMAPAPMRALLESAGFEPGAALAPFSAGHVGAPVARGRHPVIVFSHGSRGHRSETTIVVQELVSHGYIVVTVDHTGDAYTEFPGGRLSVPSGEPFTPWDYAYDLRLILDHLESLARFDHRLGRALDLDRIGMFGWSKGATATALVMNTDRRVQAGLGFDGPMQSNPAVAEIDRPFMMMAAQFTRASAPSVDQFWSRLHGWRRGLQIDGALHGSYCDHQWLIPQLATLTGMTAEELAGWIGTLNPSRAVRIQQRYPLAFFDRHLRHRRQPLLDGPSPEFPEVRFIP